MSIRVKKRERKKEYQRTRKRKTKHYSVSDVILTPMRVPTRKKIEGKTI
jgi:hypothetical protein